MHQIIVSRTLPVRKAAPWCNLFLQKLDTACCTVWYSQWKLQNVLISIWRQNHIHYEKNHTPIPHLGDWRSHLSPGYRLNSETKIKCLEEVVLISIERLSAGGSYIWQQNSSPWHLKRRTQFGYKKISVTALPSDMWPPNSIGCNPLDYYVWAAVERDAYEPPWNTKY